jgi:hypothetical protein
VLENGGVSEYLEKIDLIPPKKTRVEAVGYAGGSHCLLQDNSVPCGAEGKAIHAFAFYSTAQDFVGSWPFMGEIGMRMRRPQTGKAR